jgi:hypothetical protein
MIIESFSIANILKYHGIANILKYHGIAIMTSDVMHSTCFACLRTEPYVTVIVMFRVACYHLQIMS